MRILNEGKKAFLLLMLVLSGETILALDLALDDASLLAPSPLNPRDGAVTCMNEPSLTDASEDDLARANSYFTSWLKGLAGDAARLQEYTSNDHTFLSFFGHEHWGSSNFGCNLEHGCHQDPKCFEVKDFQLQHRRGRSDEDIERDTNIIFLVYLQIYAQNNFFMALVDGMKSARESVGLISDKLAEDFTRQPDLAVGAACEMSGLSKDILNTIFIIWLQDQLTKASMSAAMVGGATDALSLGATAMPVALVNFAVLATQERIRNVQALESIFNSMKKLHELNFQKEQIEEKRKMQKNPNQPYIDQTYEMNMCNEAKHGNRNFANSASMKKFAEHQFSKYRDYISITWGNFILPNMTDPDSIRETALWLGRSGRLMGMWVRARDVFSSSNAILDRRMQDYMMSAAWRGSRCWLECQVGGDFHTTCKGSDHRFCPNANEICQAQCWTTFETGNHIVPLYGYDKVGDWQNTLPQVLNSSRNSYFKHGNAIEAPGFKVDTTNVTMLMEECDTDRVQLPVCRSRNAVVGPVESKSKNFACTCGDWMSNETAIVMDTIQMGYQSLDFTKGWASETYLHTCPEVLKNLPPLTHYRGFCGLGIREGGYSVLFGKDDYCEPIFHHVRDQRWTEKEANINFCMRDHWGDADAVLNKYPEYRSKCKAFMKDKDKHWYRWDNNNHYD